STSPPPTAERTRPVPASLPPTSVGVARAVVVGPTSEGARREVAAARRACAAALAFLPLPLPRGTASLTPQASAGSTCHATRAIQARNPITKRVIIAPPLPIGRFYVR